MTPAGRHPKTLTFSLPHKADRDLGANSRAHWRTKYARLKLDKNTSWALTQAVLVEAGLTANDFLTGNGAYSLEDALPVQLLFKRYYSGTSKEWDDDNLASAYKGLRDGIATALDNLNDRKMRTYLEQVRQKGPARLEVVIAPAWAIKVGEGAA